MGLLMTELVFFLGLNRRKCALKNSLFINLLLSYLLINGGFTKTVVLSSLTLWLWQLSSCQLSFIEDRFIKISPP